MIICQGEMMHHSKLWQDYWDAPLARPSAQFVWPLSCTGIHLTKNNNDKKKSQQPFTHHHPINEHLHTFNTSPAPLACLSLAFWPPASLWWTNFIHSALLIHIAFVTPLLLPPKVEQRRNIWRMKYPPGLPAWCSAVTGRGRRSWLCERCPF